MNRDDEIFGEAIELPAAERAAFLDRACAGDAALRARVEALLVGHDAAEDFLERSPTVRPAEPAFPEEQPGDRIGRYTLLKKVGEGGCGVVYLAEQTEPVRRRVALKVIKLGMDTKQVIARFEAERQALAMMDHPDIARVFDAGSTDTGRPFFVMEFVDGAPMTKFCDDHSLPMDARLDLFARVCVALQHAHQKGVIHRDLKPSNILVAMHDGVPAPKIIDFGIAKATSGRLTEETLVTGFDQFIGTPAYMSPEQAELRELDIDTRSDVYSLGVLLYELLTGRPPYDTGSLVRAGIEEIRRIIREVDPPRPSTRVSTLAFADRATVARLRQAAPLQLTSVLRGDLDWIVMRCLEKDRDRRYGTASELADDVRRHLRSEPVFARPPTTAYRVQKFVARNRLVCASAAAVAAALIIGTVVSVRQAVRATAAEQVARRERDAATAAGRAEAVARTDAQRRQEQAEALLTFMLGGFRTELEKAGRLNLLDDVGEKAMSYFTALDPRDLTDTALARQAKALYQIGDTRLKQARFPEATVAFTTSYARAAELVERHPRDGDMLFERAQAEYWLGFAARRRGDLPQARAWLTRYRDSGAALVALEGKVYRAQRELTSGEHNLAVLEYDDGNLAAARRSFLAVKVAVEEMLASGVTDTSLRYRPADVASWLGWIAERDGNYAEALERLNEMSSLTQALVTLEPTVTRWRTKLADSAAFIGNVNAITGRLPEAAAAYARAQKQMESLVEQDPKNQQWLASLLTLRVSQVMLLLAEKQTAEAARVLAEALPKLEALVAAEPQSRGYIRILAAARRQDARVRLADGRAGADAAVAQAIALGEPLVREARADNWAIWEYTQSHLLAGRIALGRNDPAGAQGHWNRALEVLAPHLPTTNEWRYLDPAAQAYILLGRPNEARPFIERLKRFGYRSNDLMAVSILDSAP
ncbi:MAG: serine/threonine-protein kinase [Verrucomicrobia bacterium]|nr:serine/threonine-protein kinase [Verrucomicrobiota bacterium]